MTYLISRGNYERCTEGMTERQRAEFDRDFTQYPDRVSPDGRIDLDRVADAYAQLHARETGIPPELTFQPAPFWGRGWPKLPPEEMVAAYEAAAWHCPKGNGKSSWRPPEPWQEIGDGVYVAPPNTPMPTLFTPDPGPAPTIADQAEETRWPNHWCFINDFADAAVGETARRYFLNQWVDEPRTERYNPLADLLAWWREYKRLVPDPPRPKLLACGDAAIETLRFAGRTAKLTASDKNVIDVTGIPVVPDPDLPDDVWQLIDAETKEVLYEGIIGQRLLELLRIMREDIDDLAERAGLPRDLFY